jgi:hypothetical protein
MIIIVLFSNGKRAANIQNKKANKIYKLKNRIKNKQKRTAKARKQKALFIGNIFLRLGQSKNACALWSA